jgi:hypothetical protein
MSEQPESERDQRPLGLTWFSSEAAYDRFYALHVDSWSKSYSEWLEGAINLEAIELEAGEDVVRVYFDPDTFPAWCRENGYDVIDGDAMMDFIDECVLKATTRKPEGDRSQAN